jgi:hypothetical protein
MFLSFTGNYKITGEEMNALAIYLFLRDLIMNENNQYHHNIKTLELNL